MLDWQSSASADRPQGYILAVATVSHAVVQQHAVRAVHPFVALSVSQPHDMMC